MAEDQWTVEKLQQELLNAEKSGKFSYEELSPLWEKAKEAIESEEQAVSLYTTYIYLTRRHIVNQGSNDYTKMDELFKEASDFIAECFGGDCSEASVKLDKNYAMFLYTKLKKPDQAREIWDRLLESESGPFAFIEAITLGRAYGDLEHARRLFYRALDAVTFRPHEIFAAFVQFEREEGTREDLDRALERINARVAEFNVKAGQHQYFRQKQDKIHGGNEKQQKPRGKQPNKRENGDEQPKKGKQGQKEKTTGRGPKQEKLKAQRGEVAAQSRPAVREEKMEVEEEGMDAEKQQPAAGTFQTSQVPIGPVIPGMAIKEGDKEQGMEAEEERGRRPKEEEEKKGMGQKRGEDQGKMAQKRKRQGSASPEKSFPYGTGLEKNKLFVKQLHFGCKEAELREFFGRFGKVMDVRILTKWTGVSKGCAYVDFSTDEEAAAAVMGADGAEIRGRKMAVYLSNPPPKKPRMDSLSDSKTGETAAGEERKNAATSSNMADQQNQQQPRKKTLGQGLFAPRALANSSQRAGKGGRLMLPRSISKTTASSDIQSSFSPVGAVTHSTEEMKLEGMGNRPEAKKCEGNGP